MVHFAFQSMKHGAIRLGRCVGFAVGFGVVWGTVTAATVEDELKAVFLFNFASFIEWPPPQATEPRSDFIIGILGEDQFGTVIDQVVAEEQINGRRMVVHRFPNLDDVRVCDILFVSRSESGRLREAIARVQGKPVLTVGDAPEFAESGGMIGFSTDAGRVRLNINRGAVESARLNVSTKLLRLARVVRSRE